MAEFDLPAEVEQESVPQFVAAARQGSIDALGRLLDSYRSYLRHVCQRQIPRELQGKVAPSDVIQETLIEAQQAFDRFTSDTHSKLQAWLTELLNHNVLDLCRRYRETGKRDIAREVPLDSQLKNTIPAKTASDESVSGFDDQRLERLKLLLPQFPADFQAIFHLRHALHLSFSEIAARLNKKPDAIRMYYVRQMTKLKQRVELSDEEPG